MTLMLLAHEGPNMQQQLTEDGWAIPPTVHTCSWLQSWAVKPLGTPVLLTVVRSRSMHELLEHKGPTPPCTPSV